MNNITAEKSKKVQDTINKVQKAFGASSILQLGANAHLNVETFSSGSLSLDFALGGGVPKGRIIEIYGPESSGKTTVALHMVAEVQKEGGVCAFIDAEHALDPIYARAIGVDVDNLYVVQPDCGEQGLGIAELILENGGFDLIVVDSVAALVPKKELEGEIGDANVGLHARLMSQALRKLTPRVSKSNCSMVFINQIREKVGVMYGNPETTTGGRALKFFASVRLDVRRVETIKKGEEALANHVKVKVVKNKIAPPFKIAEFDIVFGEGISKKSEIAQLAVDMDIIQKKGGWYYYEEMKAHGIEEVKTLLNEDPDFMEEIVSAIKLKLNSQDVFEEVVPEDEFEEDSFEEPKKVMYAADVEEY